MRVLILFISLGILIAGSGCSSGEGSFRTGYDFASIEKVAIVEVTGYLKQEGVRNQIASFFEMGLLERGYAPIERARVQAESELLDEAGGIVLRLGEEILGRAMNEGDHERLIEQAVERLKQEKSEGVDSE